MLKFDNVFFSYDRYSEVLLKDISFQVDKGEYVSVLGDNGSGKSTLLKLLLGFLKTSKGSITINTNKIGYVPQRFEGFNAQFPITVKEVLNIHRKTLKIKNSSEIDTALNIVRMDSFKNNLIGNLSGGQRQKVLIARALIGSPELLILDEPSTGIDMESQKDIYDILKKLNKEDRMTIVSVEHNMGAAYNNSSKIYYMREGVGKLYSSEEFFINVNRGAVYASI